MQWTLPDLCPLSKQPTKQYHTQARCLVLSGRYNILCNFAVTVAGCFAV